MKDNKKQIKNLAKQAKERLKNHFWEDYKENLTQKVVKAKEEGENTSNVIRYYKNQASKVIQGNNVLDEEFYQKVKYILDTFGETSDIIGRLCDLEYMKGLNFQQRERYLSDVASQYRNAKERYDNEKKFAFEEKRA
ncbi:MAG: hypothetical protein IKJ19_07180 [Clostridia bacterium]|nr:hypothetical protein [Clostridia bacterium]